MTPPALKLPLFARPGTAESERPATGHLQRSSSQPASIGRPPCPWSERPWGIRDKKENRGMVGFSLRGFDGLFTGSSPLCMCYVCVA